MLWFASFWSEIPNPKTKLLVHCQVLNCTDFEGRFEYIGDEGATVYKCGVRVKNLRPEDFGRWKCDVWQYYDGSNKWRSYAASKSKSFQARLSFYSCQVKLQLTRLKIFGLIY